MFDLQILRRAESSNRRAESSHHVEMDVYTSASSGAPAASHTSHWERVVNSFLKPPHFHGNRLRRNKARHSGPQSVTRCCWRGLESSGGARNKLCFLPLSNLLAPPELRMGAVVLLKSLTNKAAGSNVETQWAPPAPWVRKQEEC